MKPNPLHILYGILLTLTTTFGGLVYNSAISRVQTLEAQAQVVANETKELARAEAQVIADIKIAMAEMKADTKYLREQVDRIINKLDALPRVTGPSRLPPQVRDQSP